MSSQQLGLFDPKKPKPRRASFHVRAHQALGEAVAGETRARRQEVRVLAFFLTHPGRWTPWQVSEALAIFIVSARRAISNLTAASELLHHETDRRPGPMGQLVSTWSLAPKDPD